MDYKTSFLISFLISFVLTPIYRFVAVKFSVYDHPISDIKTHKQPVPYFGGLAIATAFLCTLILVRWTTHFPTGTLRSFRGIVFGGIIILLLGLLDDIKYKGLHFTTKFFAEIVVAIITILYGIKIKFISPEWFGIIITTIWIIGITNAFNIIDVIDGLSSGVGIITAIAFFIIGTIAQEEIYVNYTSLALAGGCLGFLPYNLSKKYKIFMGDTGSLFIGYVISCIALGTKYSTINKLGVIVPLIILAIPIYDTFLVSIIRLRKGKSPFLGSKDHFALRLEMLGFKRHYIILISYIINILLSIIGAIIARTNQTISLVLVCLLIVFIIIVTKYLMRIDID